MKNFCAQKKVLCQHHMVIRLTYVTISGEGNGTPLQYSCLEKSHGWRSLVGCSPWGRSESDTTERLHFHALEKEWQPTTVFLPGESQGWWSLVGCRLWGRTESDMTEVTSQQQQHVTISTSRHMHAVNNF